LDEDLQQKRQHPWQDGINNAPDRVCWRIFSFLHWKDGCILMYRWMDGWMDVCKVEWLGVMDGE
jgi:hypothetical protein